MAGLLIYRDLRESFLDWRKEKQRIVAEAVIAARRVNNSPISLAATYRQRFAIASGGDDANEVCRPAFGRYVLQFAQQPSIVCLVIHVVLCQPRIFGSITSGVHPGRTVKSVYLQAGIVGNDDLAGGIAAVMLGFLARIRLEGKAIFNNTGQGREAGDGSQ